MSFVSNSAQDRDSFHSKWGFILACIGSAVGMGNIWLFPYRMATYGGTFLLIYLIFDILIGFSGVVGEMSFGRAARSGPVGAFRQAGASRGQSKLGALIGGIPMLGALALAIGYSVVVGWIFKYLFHALDGALTALPDVAAFDGFFGATATSNVVWQVAGMVITVGIMIFGISRGIELANKIMIPLFYALFLGLAIYLVLLPGTADAYRYIFRFELAGLRDPMVWVFALGQAFFSLSIAGNGTLIYGSYLDNKVDIPRSARVVALCDTGAAMLSALVIIPAMAFAGQQLNSGGPGLMFVALPNVLKTVPGSNLVLVLFFLAVTFAALTSLVN